MANPEHLNILKQGVATWNRWRSQNNEVIDLTGANLEHADLSGTNFGGGLLRKMIFNGANLANVDFSGARLAGTSFFASYLPQANFSYAALDRVTFIGTNIVSANFSKAELAYTIFFHANLKDATGLLTCNHLAPSSVDLVTLQRSGSLPETFLRGCGFPDKLIKIIPSLVGQAPQFYSCFISHSTKDEEFARRLHARMTEANMGVWFAPEDIRGGKKLHEQLFEAIQIHDRLLLVLSEHSIQSEWVMTEIRKAREVEKKENRRKLFPIRLTDFETLRDWTCFDADSGKDLAVEVREYFIPDFSNWKDHDAFESSFAKLKKDLEAENSKK